MKSIASVLPGLAELELAHSELREHLPEILLLARKVESIHGPAGEFPLGLTAQLEKIWRELQQHMQKEENLAFAAIREGRPFGQGVAEILREHEAQFEEMHRIRERCAGFVSPPHACRSWVALYRSLEQLEGDLTAHLHQENSVFFCHTLGA